MVDHHLFSEQCFFAKNFKKMWYFANFAPINTSNTIYVIHMLQKAYHILSNLSINSKQKRQSQLEMQVNTRYPVLLFTQITLRH